MRISENFGIHIFSGFSAVLINVEKIHVRIILGHPIDTYGLQNGAFTQGWQNTVGDLIGKCFRIEMLNL